MPWNWQGREKARGTVEESKVGRAWPSYEAEYLHHRLSEGDGKYDCNFADARDFVYLQKVSSDYKEEADQCLLEEFKSWLQGTHADNINPAVYTNAPGKPQRRVVYGRPGLVPGTLLEGWKPTRWGANRLTDLPGVQNFLRSGAMASMHNDLQMNLLAEHGPQDLESAWMYFKHWVKGRPVAPESCVSKRSSRYAARQPRDWGRKQEVQNEILNADPSVVYSSANEQSAEEFVDAEEETEEIRGSKRRAESEPLIDVEEAVIARVKAEESAIDVKEAVVAERVTAEKNAVLQELAVINAEKDVLTAVQQVTENADVEMQRNLDLDYKLAPTVPEVVNKIEKNRDRTSVKEARPEFDRQRTMDAQRKLRRELILQSHRATKDFSALDVPMIPINYPDTKSKITTIEEAVDAYNNTEAQLNMDRALPGIFYDESQEKVFMDERPYLKRFEQALNETYQKFNVDVNIRQTKFQSLTMSLSHEMLNYQRVFPNETATFQGVVRTDDELEPYVTGQIQHIQNLLNRQEEYLSREMQKAVAKGDTTRQNSIVYSDAYNSVMLDIMEGLSHAQNITNKKKQEIMKNILDSQKHMLYFLSGNLIANIPK